MKIIFKPMTPDHKYGFRIEPAIKHLPEWYKKMPMRYMGNKGQNLLDGNDKFGILITASTKACSPFLDALTSGYMVTTSADMEYGIENGAPVVRWKHFKTMVEMHHKDQIESLPNPVDCSKDTFKWVFDYSIQTPKGFSCLFTHPLNRHELPFRTLSGVVDTDTYFTAVQFPFQFMNLPADKQYQIIPKGTPIVQIMPFKRLNWESEYEEYDENFAQEQQYSLVSKLIKSYKTQFWQRKTYN